MARDDARLTPSGEGDQTLLRVDRLGPAGGGCVSMLGALLVMAGFLMPWASCGGNSVTGLNLATGDLPFDLPNQGAALLGLVPCLSLGLLGIGLGMLPLAARERIRAGLFSLRAAAGVALGGLAVAGLCLAGAFLAGVRQAQEASNDLFGLGGVIAVQSGFWISAVGMLVSLAGAAIALVTSFVKIPLKRM
jgi:hypothetical protein